jgi:arabinofuranan 3-O-arabinosyltransferase
MNTALKNCHSETGSGQKSSRLSGIAAGWSKLLDIEDRIFTQHNLQLYGFGVAWVWTLFAGWLLFVKWINDGLRSIDFCWIWVSGKLAPSSNPALVYDPAAFTVALRTFLGTDVCRYLHFSYPPTVLFFAYPFGLLPYMPAFAVWIVATIVLYLVAVYAIIPRPAAVIAALTPMAVPVNVLFGHNGFLTAGLIGLSLVFVERRPWLSGILFGLLTYKPQFGVLLPLALLASRNWRTLCWATASSVVLSAAATAAFGYRGWPSFIDLLWHRNSALSTDGVELELQSIYGLLYWAGVSTWLSWTVHLAVAIIVAIAVCAVWAKPIPHPLKAAILSIGALMVTPYVLRYDLCILSIPVAFLVKDGLSRGFLAGERTVILICIAAFLFWLALPIGPAFYPVILFLIARRIVACRRDAFTALLPILPVRACRVAKE